MLTICMKSKAINKKPGIKFSSNYTLYCTVLSTTNPMKGGLVKLG